MNYVPFSVYCCRAIRCRWKTFPKILNLCSGVRTIGERACMSQPMNAQLQYQFLVSAKGIFRPFQLPKTIHSTSLGRSVRFFFVLVDDHDFGRERERQRAKTLWQSDQPLFSLCSDDVEIRLTKKLFVLSPYFVFVTSVHSIESLQMHSHCPFEYRFLSNFAAANFIRIGKSTIFPLRTPKNAQFSQKCVEKFCARWRSVGGFSDLLTFFLQIFRHNFPVLQIQFNSI